MVWNLHQFLTTSKLSTLKIQVTFKRSCNPCHGAKHAPSIGVEEAKGECDVSEGVRDPAAAPCYQGEPAEKQKPVWTLTAPAHSFFAPIKSEQNIYVAPLLPFKVHAKYPCVCW